MFTFQNFPARYHHRAADRRLAELFMVMPWSTLF